MSQDEDHLRLLSIFHYVVGGLVALVACFPLIRVAVGLMMVFSPELFGDPSKQPPVIGWLFAGIAATFILTGWILAILVTCAARCLQRRKHYTFCFAMACVECVFMPFVTVLGVFTLVVLLRPTVKAFFGQATAAP